MQINEITHPQQLNEVDIVGGIKKAVSGVQGAVAGFQQQQQQKTVQQNTQAVSKAALQQWNNKLIQLQQAGVPDTQWKDHLQDFVERVMLRSYKLDDLADKQGVERAMQNVIAAGMDRRKLEPAFTALVQQSMASRVDPTKASYQSRSTQATTTNQTAGTQQQLNPTQAAQAAADAIRAARINPQVASQEIQKAAGGPLAVRTTNNPMVDALLKSLGIQVQ